jgi:glycine hydroxymethyltransferase
MTTRGMQPEDFERIAEIIHRAVGITQRLDKEARMASEEKGRKNPGSIGALLELLRDNSDVDVTQFWDENEAWAVEFALPWENLGQA